VEEALRSPVQVAGSKSRWLGKPQMPPSTIFFFVVLRIELARHSLYHLSQAPASSSQVAGITGVHQHVRPCLQILF
jgi:hypothetical protein